VLVDIEMTVSHPRFKKLNEDFGLGPFADIVRQTTYIAVQRDNRTVFVVGGYDANTEADRIFNVYDRMILFKKAGQYTLISVRYVSSLPKEYENDNIYLKIFNRGNFGFSTSKGADLIKRSYQEPDDVWFEYKVKEIKMYYKPPSERGHKKVKIMGLLNLFKSAWQSKDKEKRLEAVKR
jgi:hypothetical protein